MDADRIRQAYREALPAILEARAKSRRHRTDPYILPWSFTPIEQFLWDDLRSHGLPFYPQFPVGPYLLDFGDPYLRIGVEADGRDFHDVERDRARDTELYRRHGWRVFRIPGKQAWQGGSPWENADEMTVPELDSAVYRWTEQTGEGVVWSLGVHYYELPTRRFKQRNAAWWSLRQHHLASFPIHAPEDARPDEDNDD